MKRKVLVVPELREVWVVEVKPPREDWGAVEAHPYKEDAQRERRDWKKAAPFSQWRVKRYVPDDCTSIKGNRHDSA